MDMPRHQILRLVLVYTGSAEGPDALWRITRHGNSDRPEWSEFKRTLRVQVDEMNALDLPLFIKSAISPPPCIAGRYSIGRHSVILPAPVIRQYGDVKSLVAALRNYGIKYNVDLGFPE